MRSAECIDRGTRGTYQAWADMVDDQSYNWDRFLPYFMKSTSLTPPDYSRRQSDSEVAYDHTVFDNLGGPLQISWPNYAVRWGSNLLEAMQKTGISMTDAFDNGSLLGAAWSASTIDPIK